MESDYPKASQLIKGERSQLWSVSSPPPLEPESVYRFLQACVPRVSAFMLLKS